MSPRKFPEQEFLTKFSVALHALPADDAELVLHMDAYRMYLLGLIRSPETTFRDMQATFRRAKEIKERVVSSKDVDLDALVRYFQNDLPALRMALPRTPGKSLSTDGVADSRSPVEILEERKTEGRALRKLLLALRSILTRLAEGSLPPDRAAEDIRQTAFRGRTPRTMIDSLVKLQSGRKAWESSLPSPDMGSDPPDLGGHFLHLDEQSAWYPIQIFSLRLIDHLKRSRSGALVTRCKNCDTAFVRTRRETYCTESCRRKGKRGAGK